MSRKSVAAALLVLAAALFVARAPQRGAAGHAASGRRGCRRPGENLIVLTCARLRRRWHIEGATLIPLPELLARAADESRDAETSPPHGQPQRRPPPI